MELALSFSDADAARIKHYAAKKNMNVLDYAKRAVMKPIEEEDSLAAQNAAYAAKIEESRKQFAEGRFVTKTWEELAQLAHE
ncbi:MAG: hypothetical protein IJS96_01885 [Schwartzia sp.]|nr:hypothetical protein [Schwartzia sp. (in: firmicutes)]